MNSLQQITDAWGKWYVNQAYPGKAYVATASTDYSAQPFTPYQQQYQTSIQVQSINYTGNTFPTLNSTDAYDLWYDNNTTVPGQQTFQHTTTSTLTFTWNITEALALGVEVSATEEFPAVASATEQVSVNISLSSTQEQTSTTEQTWSVDSTITIPADSSVYAEMVITNGTYDVSFTQAVILQGYVAVQYIQPLVSGSIDLVPIQSVFTDCVNNGIDTTGYSVLAGGIATQAAGVFTGSQGVSVGVSVDQYPLRTPTEISTKSDLSKPNSGASSSALLAITKQIPKA